MKRQKKKKEKSLWEFNEETLKKRLARMIGAKRAESLIKLVGFNGPRNKKKVLIDCLEVAEEMKKRERRMAFAI